MNDREYTAWVANVWREHLEKSSCMEGELLSHVRKSLLEKDTMSRRTGRTKAGLKNAYRIGAVYVAHNGGDIKRLQDESFGAVPIISLDTYMNPNYHRGKRNEKFVFDSMAEYVLIQRKLHEVELIMKGEV